MGNREVMIVLIGLALTLFAINYEALKVSDVDGAQLATVVKAFCRRPLKHQRALVQILNAANKYKLHMECVPVP